MSQDRSQARRKVAVVAPVVRFPLSVDEEISMRHLRKYLGAYDRYIIGQAELPDEYSDFKLKHFAPEYFSGVYTYNRLLLTEEFYRAFEEYEYILIYQMDCLVFADKVEEWCGKGWDYVGAPWLKNIENPEEGFCAVGNGGFSLRRVSKALEVFRSKVPVDDPETRGAVPGRLNFFYEWLSEESPVRRAIRGVKTWMHRHGYKNNVPWRTRLLAATNYHEDYFWAYEAGRYVKEFRIPGTREALEFSFELAPRYCYEANGKRMPFGCHAWPRYDRAFWEPYLLPAPDDKTATGYKEAWPKITLVTAVRNGAKYIEDTMRSVIAQKYPNLEYIVVDGASTDGTQEIIKKYEEHLTWWVSQPDNGLYDALNTGFAQSTGEIMGWLNASDMLHTGGLAVVGNVFRALPEVQWMTGRPTAFGADDATIYVGGIPRWGRERYLAGANRYIQQESTYWRRELWEKAGGYVDGTRRDASDCELWTRFFRHAKLYTVDSLIGGYRMHADSILAMDRAGYDRSLEEIVLREVESLKGEPWIRAFRGMTRVARKIPKLHGFWNRVVIPALYGVRGPDWPPVIWHYGGEWACRKKTERPVG